MKIIIWYNLYIGKFSLITIVRNSSLKMKKGRNIMIAKCKKCSNNFTYREVIKSIWINRKINCKICNKENEIELITSFLLYSIIFLPTFIKIFRNESEFNNLLIFTMKILYLIFIIIISPFFIRYE